MTKILVTGANGFIGDAVCTTLEQQGFEVVAFDRRSVKHTSRETYLGDVRDEMAVIDAMSHVEGFIHLAGILGTAETVNDPRPATQTNVLGGLNILFAAQKYDIPGVNIGVGNYFENNTYSITKNSVERFVSMYAKEHSLSVATTRCLNIFGPGQSVAAPYGESKVRKVIPSFVCRAILNDPIQIYGNGLQIMDMCYITDAAAILVQTLITVMSTDKRGFTVEAGTGRPTSVNEIAQLVVKEVGQGNIEHISMRAGETENSVVLGKPETLSLIGLENYKFVTLEDGLQTTVEYYREYLSKR